MNVAYDDLIAFHGHSCPGLAIGYRMTMAAMDFLSSSHAAVEELVAIVENNACGVDALQYISGCTFGKGNFIFKDYGKQVYTLYNRNTRKGVRVVFNPQNIPEDIFKDRERFAHWLLTSDEGDVVSLKEVHIEEPEPARIMDTVVCESCGELVMSTRTRELDGKTVCIPCSEKHHVS
ncbi:MAG: TraR/DksA C4-type zinc finger protein [Chloroflexi bacterium]|nr:TraR/DksA C4-type zinc finger protein [Chloroflexota bacterium]